MKAEAIVREYVKRLSDDDLMYLGVRFKQNLFGDKADVAEKLSQDEEIDRLLSTSTCSEELFAMFDLVAACVKMELNRREGDEDEKKHKKRKRDT